MPGSPAGGPTGPGATPAVSPGPGTGNQAAAAARVQAIMPLIRMAMMAFPIGSKEEKALARALSSLTPIFAKAQDDALVPAAVVDIAQQARNRGPMSAAPPPGIQPAMPGGPGGPAPGAPPTMPPDEEGPAP